MKKIAFILILSALSTLHLFAQDAEKQASSGLLVPSISVRMFYQPTAALYDTSLKDYDYSAGSYSYGEAMIGGVIPVWNKRSSSASGVGVSQAIALNAATRLGAPQYSGFQTQRQLIGFSGGLSYLYSKKNKYTIYANGTASTLQDNYILKTPFVRWGAFATYSRTAGKVFNYHIGAAYGYAYQQQVWFPLIGFSLKLDEKDRLYGTFPTNLTLHHTINDKVSYLIRLRPNGLVSNIWARNENFGNYDSLQFRVSSLNLGYSLAYHPEKNVFLRCEVGMSALRKIQLSYIFGGVTNNIHRDLLAPAPYVQVSAVYRFADKKEKGISNGDIINYLDINDVDIDQLINEDDGH